MKILLLKNDDFYTGADEMMLLACDGIWDVLSNAEACGLVRTLLMEVRERPLPPLSPDFQTGRLVFGPSGSLLARCFGLLGPKVRVFGADVRARAG